LRTGSFCVLMLLAGCATHTEQPAPMTQAASPAGVPAAGVLGIILAIRPVPAERPGPARTVLAGLGSQDSFTDGQVFEFIVRTENGTTISIVQPQTNDLHAGARISILRGAETRIETPATD